MFSLRGSPRTLDELSSLSSRRWLERLHDPKLDRWFREVSSGRAIFGEVNYQTRHKVTLKDDRSAYTACALDALIEGFFQPVNIESKCFHCDQKVSLRMSRGKVSRVQPSTVAVWLGASREAACTCETEACPYINFFVSEKHVFDWKEKNPNELGMTLTLQQSLDLARKGWWEPVHQSLLGTKADPVVPEV